MRKKCTDRRPKVNPKAVRYLNHLFFLSTDEKFCFPLFFGLTPDVSPIENIKNYQYIKTPFLVY